MIFTAAVTDETLHWVPKDEDSDPTSPVHMLPKENRPDPDVTDDFDKSFCK